MVELLILSSILTTHRVDIEVNHSVRRVNILYSILECILSPLSNVVRKVSTNMRGGKEYPVEEHRVKHALDPIRVSEGVMMSRRHLNPNKVYGQNGPGCNNSIRAHVKRSRT